MAQPTDLAEAQTRQNSEFLSAVYSAKILIVDDMPLMRKIIGMSLERGGFTNLSYAEDGRETLQIMDEDPPELLILDLKMPNVNGYEVCTELRSDKRFKNLPILVQSASETPEERVEVFSAGATDFVSKPINKPELIARVRMHLENRFLIKSLTDFRENMKNELKMATDMQKMLLPEALQLEELEDFFKVKFESDYRASSDLGGDLWGCWALPNNKIGIYILDIAGHGVGAALNTFRVHATMARLFGMRVDPASFLTELNHALVDSFPLGQFATMFYGVLDAITGRFVYAGAGAPKPMIVSDGNVRLLDSSGLPIGISRTAEYVNLEDRFQPGESLFCYSDVLIEAPQEDGFLGEQGLVEWVEELSETGPRQLMVQRVLDRFYATQPNELTDDLTAVAIHRNEDSKGE